MTVDRTALRRLLHSWLDADQAAVYGQVPDLLDDLDAKDRRIAELEALSAAGARAVDVMDDIGEQARAKIADLQLRLSIATELNVNDRRRIAELEAELAKEAEATHQLAEEHEKQGMDLAFHRRGHNDALATIAELESRLAASRGIIRHFEQERDSWPAAYRERAKRTDARIGELEAIVESTDDLVRQLRSALGVALEIGQAGEGNESRWNTLTKHVSKLLHSEET